MPFEVNIQKEDRGLLVFFQILVTIWLTSKGGRLQKKENANRCHCHNIVKKLANTKRITWVTRRTWLACVGDAADRTLALQTSHRTGSVCSRDPPRIDTHQAAADGWSTCPSTEKWRCALKWRLFSSKDAIRTHEDSEWVLKRKQVDQLFPVKRMLIASSDSVNVELWRSLRSCFALGLSRKVPLKKVFETFAYN